MKLKITILSAVALSVILIVFDTFIYFTLSNHLISLEKAVYENRVQTVVQYELNHKTDETGAISMTGAESVTWLRQHTQEGQSIAVVAATGKVLVTTGDTAAAQMQKWFAVGKGATQEITRDPDGGIYVLTQAPIVTDGGKTLGYVWIASDISYVSEYLKSLLMVLAIGSTGAVLLAAIGGYGISATAVRPIRHMIALVKRIEANRLDERVTVPKGRDEVAQLALTFNRMLARIERSFEQQARFVADASHEIRTPLTTIQGYATLLRRWGKDDPAVLEKAIRVIQKESTRLRELADDLLTLASLEGGEQNPTGTASVTQIVEEVVESFAPLYTNIQFTVDIETDITVAMSANHLKRALMNIVDNALKYSPPGTTVSLQVKRDGKQALLTVEDVGRGIPEEDLEHIFDRFYRVEKSRARKKGGAGLGLSIVRDLVELYAGQVVIESVLQQGTRVILTVPIA